MTDIKRRILEGTRRTDELYVPEFEAAGGCRCGGNEDDCPGMVELRSLTDLEQDEVIQASVEGQVYSGEPGEEPDRMSISLADSQGGQARSKRLAVAYAMTTRGESWTVEEVAQLPPEAVKRIYRKVRELTGGLPKEGEAQSFRTNGRGSGGRGPSPDRDAAGAASE